MVSKLIHEMCDVSLTHIPMEEAIKLFFEASVAFQSDHIWAYESGIITIQSLDSKKSLRYIVTACSTDDSFGQGYFFKDGMTQIYETKILRHKDVENSQFGKYDVEPSLNKSIRMNFGKFLGEDMTGTVDGDLYPYSIEGHLYIREPSAFKDLKKARNIPINYGTHS